MLVDFDILPNLTNLTQLHIVPNNNITNIDTLTALSQLQKLYIGCCDSLINIGGLVSCTDLRIICVVANCTTITTFFELPNNGYI